MRDFFESTAGKIAAAAVGALIISAVILLATSRAGASPQEDIGIDQAKTIALEDAGVKLGDVTFTTAKSEKDDGRFVYEVDFYTADREYDYEIDAATGKILERDSEPLHEPDDGPWDDDGPLDDDRWDD